jgi:hypothetical protein
MIINVQSNPWYANAKSSKWIYPTSKFEFKYPAVLYIHKHIYPVIFNPT